MKTYKATIAKDQENLEKTIAIIQKNTAKKIIENGWVNEETFPGETTLQDLQDFIENNYTNLSAKTTVENPRQVTIRRDAFNYHTFDIDTEKVRLDIQN